MTCCEPHFRSFLSKAEKVDLLKQYKEELANELKGVEDRIKELGE